MAIIHGGNVLVLNGSGTAVVAGATNCDIDMQCEGIEVAGPLSGEYREVLAGRKGWTVTLNYLVTDDLSSLRVNGTKVTLRIQVRGASSYMQGTALVSECRVTATKGNLCQGSFVFTGSGALE